MNTFLPEIIGQKQVKSTLEIYHKSFQKTGVLPFFLFTAEKGGGKTFIVRKFRESLKRPDGSRPPMWEINSSNITNLNMFLERVYPVWVGNKAFLFLDECHNLHPSIQEFFLSVLNSEPSPIRVVDNREFNFKEISICFASTDQQKIVEALRDRLEEISLEEYSDNELFTIFSRRLGKNIDIEAEARYSIIDTFRGNARDAEKKAEKVLHFLSGHGKNKLTKDVYSEICNRFGIHAHGLNNAEIKILKVLGKRGACTLNGLASSTGFSRSVIQNVYEKILVRHRLLEIDGKRRLTEKGVTTYLKLK